MDDQLYRGVARSRTFLGLVCAVAAVAAAVTGPAAAQRRGQGDQQRNGAERAAARIDERVDTVDHSVEAYVSDDALQVQYIRELQIEGFGPVEARAGVFYNEQRDLIGIGEALAYIGDQADRRQIEVSVGTRMYAAFLNTENEDTFSMGLGGEAAYFFGRQARTSIKLSLFYAPDILSFGIADDITDASIRLQTRIREGTDIFVGYRSLEISTSLGDREVDDNLHIGFRRSF
jgi:hypothetical protein